MFAALADYFVLYPTTDPIEVVDKQPRWIDGPVGRMEVWEQAVDRPEADGESLLMLKFAGAGGRGERSTAHPLDIWTEHPGIVWTVNPPGYGASPGRPSIRHLAGVAESMWRGGREAYPDRPVFLCGNSLGCLPSLYLAARYGDKVAGVLLRNPPPLRDVIRARSPWWQSAFLSWGVALGVPRELDAVENAGQAKSPMVVVTSGKDRIVPAHLQQKILQAYGGSAKQLLVPAADHADPIGPEQADEYRQLLNWLLDTRQSLVGKDN